MNQKKLAFIPQLDSFRFIAVSLVMLSHWLPGLIINRVPNGVIGVMFFFVLSGYLISTNLLYAKESIDAGLLTRGQAFKTFYIRRTLRIFPLYYFVIIVVFLLNSNIFNGHIVWYLAYIPNFLFFKIQSWEGVFAHLWSLGAEEQFYLIWPFLIFFIREKYFKYLFPSMIAMSVLCKLCLYFYMPSNKFSEILTINCFDAFGVGASIALITVKKKDYNFLIDKMFWVYLIGMAVVSTIVYITGLLFLFRLSVSIASALIILKASKGFVGVSGKILDNSILQYFGKISYGIYIYHNFAPWLMRCIRGKENRYPIPIPTFPMNWLHSPVLLMAMQFLLTIALASVSWFVIEKPILNLKKFFT
jgi:peptidoglycan/LPS O-acetylase OafA/YrhL